ncbi:hypothetical protein [Actinoplanes sp. RD1]|uniref:hypothetical protein n=1 Tax=Actinoplanes sp. RD1 TaxID=3064538 RepID=UPI002741BE76|nr:hypothetical protein [Actinoplanes sp. RD1]
MGDQTETELTEDDRRFAEQLVKQIEEIYILPELTRRGTPGGLGEVRKALAILPPDSPPRISLDNEVEFKATGVRVSSAAVGANSKATLDDILDIDTFEPADDVGDSGWVGLIRLSNGSVLIAFDFRYNKDKAVRHIALSESYLASAREAASSGRDEVALDTMHTAAENAATALMHLSMDHETPGSGRRRGRMHGKRDEWLHKHSSLGNLDQEISRSFGRLLSLRASARYGEPALELKDNEVAELLESVEKLVALARGRVA